jgi:hypothetical protein
VEEHGGEKQYVRLRNSLQIYLSAVLILLALTSTIVLSVIAQQWIVAGITALVFGLFAARLFFEKSCALHSIYSAFNSIKRGTMVAVPATEKQTEHAVPLTRKKGYFGDRVKKPLAAP